MSSAAEANFQTLARVTQYAIEDIQTLDQESWFKHDNVSLKHTIRRNGETFAFSKEHYSGIEPTNIGYVLKVPQDGQPSNFVIWVRDPVADTAVNRKVVVKALERLGSVRNLATVELSTKNL